MLGSGYKSVPVSFSSPRRRIGFMEEESKPNVCRICGELSLSNTLKVEVENFNSSAEETSGTFVIQLDLGILLMILRKMFN